MKSPPRDELNPIRGLLGTRDDFPPVTDNRKTVRPRGRPLIILMYASLTPASSAKDRMAPAEWGVEGRGLYAHVYERQPSLPPVPEGPLRISPTAVWATAGRSVERRGKKKKKQQPSRPRPFITMAREWEYLHVRTPSLLLQRAHHADRKWRAGRGIADRRLNRTHKTLREREKWIWE